MNKYSLDQVRQILEETKDTNICFGENDRQRVLSNPNLTKKLEMLRNAGDELRGTPIYELRYSAFKRYHTDGNRTEYESDPTDGYFIRRRKLTVFAILAWLYEKQEDIDYLQDILWAICTEFTWSLPAHLPSYTDSPDDYCNMAQTRIDLFASETASGIAETLSLVGNKLDAPVRQLCEREIKRRVLNNYNYEFGIRPTANWICVCNGGCGIAALYCEKDPYELARIITDCINALPKYCNTAVTSDGACSEGLGYWAYGMGFYTYFADLLYRRTAGRINLFEDPKIHALASFFCNGVFPKGQYVSFADMWGKTIFYALPGLLCKLKEIYPETELCGYELMDFTFPEILRLRFARELREFVWVSKDLESIVTENYGTHIYPDSQLYISTSKNNISIAAKGGNNGEDHNHNDVGSFMLVKDGVRILDDIGASEYVKGYFGENRYSHFAPSSLSHNLPVIDGKGQSGGKEFAAKNVIIAEDSFSADIAGAYGMDKLLSLTRKIDFDKVCGKTVITDTFNFAKAPQSLSERFVTPTKPKISEGEIVFGDGGRFMTMRYDPEKLEPTLSTVTDIRHDITEERITYIVDLFVKSPSENETVKLTIE